jgi:eukaryotic-like serine/threonine-protein kinase
MREQTIFIEALEIADPAERAAFLDRASGGDAAVRERVEKLLHRHQQDDSFLAGPAVAPALTGAYTPEPGGAEAVTGPIEGPGTVVGPYKLLQQIGEGGMGVVYMAEQSRPVRRVVALKIIKPGMDSRHVIARFEAERQALALMDHPNIARVLDGGTTETGRPYFVMELVKGVPITKFCDERRLTPRQRLELFVPVCQAVQHAHQKGIIHRDLKPSNVLIAMYDDKPVPKVIDFGIAKATGQKLTERTMFTEFGQVVGTLEYMSPEQAGLNQLDIDTRSDIYSLGVLLYELLTGSTPLEKKRLKEAAMLEVLRLIREEEPPKPSTRLSTTDEMPSVAANRGLEPKKLSGLVRGELDWIVMKALEKDRNRRYETANGFAADVQRYLADEPVQACPPSAWYRLRKFGRRNKAPVLAGGVFLLLLVAGVVGTSIGLVRALVAERQAVTERDEKEEARQQTRQALNTMTDEVVEELLGRQVRLTDKYREFLKKVLAYHAAFAAAEGDDAEGRRGRADGYFRVGQIRFSLGEVAEAEPAYREALALRQQLADEFPDRTEFRVALALSHEFLGRLLTGAGRRKEAEQEYRKTLALRKKLADELPQPEALDDLTKIYGSLAFLLQETERPKEAEEAYQAALGIAERLARQHPGRYEFLHSLAVAHSNLGYFLNATDRLKESEKAYNKSLEVSKKLVAWSARPESRLDLAKAHLILGVMQQRTARPKEAEVAFRDAVTVGRQLAAEFPARPDIHNELAITYNNLGMLLSDTGRLPEAEAAWRDALALYKQLAADLPSQPDYRQGLLLGHHNLGVLLKVMDRPKDAEAAFRDAVAVGERLAADFPDQPKFRQQLAHEHASLGHLLSAGGRHKEAEKNWSAGLRLYEKLVAGPPPRPELRKDMALFHFHRGIALQGDGRLEEAIAEFREAIGINKEYADAYYQFGCRFGSAIDLERLEEAIAAYRVAIQKKKFPQGHVNLGNALQKMNRRKEAMDEFREAIRLDFHLVEAHVNLGDALLEEGEPDKAIAEFRAAININKDIAGAHYGLGNALYPRRLKEAREAYLEAIRLNKKFPRAHVNLGNTLQKMGRSKEGMDEYRKAIGLDPDLLQARSNLAIALENEGRLDDAIAEYREAIRIKKDDPVTRNNLGNVLRKMGRLKEAIAEFREAIQIRKDDAAAHFYLGLALSQQGEFREALKELRLGHELGSKRTNWPHPSAQLVRRCERLVELDEKLPGFLGGKIAPASPAERAELAGLCALKRLPRAAARFFEEAFVADPKLADDLDAGHRYDAACVSALAGRGKGKDADKLEDKERARLRRRALDWLRADLDAWGRLLAKAPHKARPLVVQKMRHWLDDADFAGVRGPKALAELPESEREPWQKLWGDVADTLARAQGKSGPEKK